MLAARRKGLGRRGTAAGGSAFLAVALALVLVAAETPLLAPRPNAADGGQGNGLLEQVLQTERAWIEQAATLAWGEVRAEEHEPLLRARLAAEEVALALDGRYPRQRDAVAVELTEVAVTNPDGRAQYLPPEVTVRVVGTLIARTPDLGSRSAWIELEAPDPRSPRALRYLEDRLQEQALDPRSEAAAAVRAATAPAAFAEGFSGERLQWVVDRALEKAALAVSARMGGSPLPADDSGAQGEGRANPLISPAEAATSALNGISGPDFGRYLRGFLFTQAGTGPGAALLSLLDAANVSLVPAARAVLAGNLTRLAELLGVFPSRAAYGLDQVAGLLRDAALAFGNELQSAADRAQRALDRLAPRTAALPSGNPDIEVSFRAERPRLSVRPIVAATVAAGGLVVPGATEAVLSFVLSGSIRVLEGARWLEGRRVDPVQLTFLSAGRAAGGNPSVGELDAGPAVAARAVLSLEPLAWATRLVDDLRLELDLRLTTFRDAVTERIAKSSAAAVARLALRVLNGLADDDGGARSARALFELLERYVADDLRTALTFNFSIVGVNFTVVPDPVAKQISLEHREGPHTFGARVRHIADPENPLRGRYSDHLSLALEAYWRYEAPPVTASLTVDPFWRTDDGLLRFAMRVDEGDGFALAIAAPRLVRRAGVLEVSLSDFLPGGIPVGITPSGGAISLDAGVRAEIARLPPLGALRFVVGAIEEALLDLAENQTVREMAEQLSVNALARRLLDRLVGRLADTFASDASRFVLRVDFFARVRYAEAAGLASARLEVSLAVLEPVLVLRALSSAVGALHRALQDGAFSARQGPTGAVDWLPSAAHERIGLGAKFALHGGLDGVPLIGRALESFPSAEVFQSVFVSLGAVAAASGRRSVHSVSDYSLGFEGFGSVPSGLLGRRIGKEDALEAAHLRVESLAGPRILISEVLPSPSGKDSDLEFVELYNPGFAEEDLSGWSVVDAGGRSFRLPDGTRIAPNGTLVVSRSALPFLLRFGVASEVPTLTLALNDEGDRLRLLNPRGWTSDTVAWGASTSFTPDRAPDLAIARLPAVRAPVDLPGSALQFTGLPLDFRNAAPSPGTLP